VSEGAEPKELRRLLVSPLPSALVEGASSGGGKPDRACKTFNDGAGGVMGGNAAKAIPGCLAEPGVTLDACSSSRLTTVGVAPAGDQAVPESKDLELELLLLLACR
jgi:hypothetical protein